LWSAGVSYSQNEGWSANAAGFTISASGINFDPSVGMSVNLQDYILEQKTGEISREDYKDALERAKNYNKYSSTGLHDDLLRDKIKNEFNGFQEGKEVSKITTRTNSYGIDSYGRYINRKGEIIGGYFYHPLIGFKSLHISLNTLNADNVTFRAIAGHEIIHAVHYYSIKNYNKNYSERVAYEYTAQVYGKASNYLALYGYLRVANQYYNGAIPMDYFLYHNKYIISR